jgi:transcriptional regulator with XRE-family HTH domain
VNRLKELREEAMMTVRELSERSGVSEDTITKIENGHRKGRGVTLRKLAKALGTTYDELVPKQVEQTAQRRYPDGIPRMNISERQQQVLITVLECGEVGPADVAGRLDISVSTAYRDLSILEEHGLVVID